MDNPSDNPSVTRVCDEDMTEMKLTRSRTVVSCFQNQFPIASERLIESYI